MKRKDLVKLLNEMGWTTKRMAGSHEIFIHPRMIRPIPLPMHGADVPAASPKPATKRGQRVVFVPVAAHIRSAWMLRELRGQAGLSREEMAARLGLAPRLLERLENAEHQAPPLDILDRAARLVGRELVLSTVVLVG